MSVSWTGCVRVTEGWVVSALWKSIGPHLPLGSNSRAVRQKDPGFCVRQFCYCWQCVQIDHMSCSLP
jgi:hypothetical protein